MHLRGIIRGATLEENPPGSDAIEMVLNLQGVGADQPRTIVVPFEVLLGDETLGPDSVLGHGFEADIEQDAARRWVVTQISVAPGRVLRREE
jgi:hypothetical protein